jgi:site-specific DNA-methyltransferase (adenine-specific)
MRTRFFRFLVLLNKPTQHATSKVYGFVPVQDFKTEWTDEILYEKYNLNVSEISFIEKMIRPMTVSDE